MSETVPSDGSFAYGGYPDIDALYKQQARETDRAGLEPVVGPDAPGRPVAAPVVPGQRRSQ